MLRFPWGLGVFDLDPGRFPGDKITMTFTYYHAPAATAAYGHSARPGDQAGTPARGVIPACRRMSTLEALQAGQS